VEEAEKLLDRSLARHLKLLAASPTNMGRWTSLAFANFDRGRLLTLKNQSADAEKAFVESQRYLERIIDAQPMAMFRRYELAIALGHLGWLYLREPRRKALARKALPLVQQALKLAPDGGTFLAALEGLAYYRLGQWDRAIASLKAARARAENSDEPHDQWGKKADGANMIVAAQRREKTAQGLILMLLALSYHQQGKAGQAADFYQRAQRWRARHPFDPRHAAEFMAIEAETVRTLGVSQPKKCG
jgi:tetratricopeptide (TPR) repeat protein